MGAPAGLKLHAELSHVLGSIAQMWLRYSEAAYMLIGRNTMLMRGNRDALAVLRRQYGLENSPRKRRQDTSHHNKQNGLALEQMIVGVLTGPRGDCVCAHYHAAAVARTVQHQPSDFFTNGAREMQSVAASATHIL
ncbi:hypothetical protein WJX82_009923 [Trebouxia sp. C0006]